MKEKNNLDNTSGVLGRLSLGLTEARDITQTVNELSEVDPHEEDVLYDPPLPSPPSPTHTRILRRRDGPEPGQENGKEVGDAVLQEQKGLRQGAQGDGRTRWLQGDYDEVAGHQQGRPAESELQSLLVWIYVPPLRHWSLCE